MILILVAASGIIVARLSLMADTVGSQVALRIALILPSVLQA